MRILIDGRFWGLENAGLGRYTINLITELSGIDSKNSYGVLLRKKYFNRLKLPRNWTQVLADFKHYSFGEQFFLPQIIASFKPELVHFLHFNVPVFYSGKFLVTVHDILMHRQKGLEATTLPAPAYYLKRLAYKYVFRHAVEKSLKIIAPSDFIKNEIVDYYQLKDAKIAVTYEGFDEKILSGSRVDVLRKYELDKPYFIYAGNAYPHKNLKRAVQAVCELNRERENQVYLVIVSARNVFTEKLKKLVREFKAEGQVKLLGFVDDNELGNLYRNSVAFIFPSLSEGFGLPGLEAMAVGTLVLASDIPVFREVYKNAATFFNPFDFSSIQRAMKDTLEISPEEREQVIVRGKEFAKRYSWDKMAKQTLKIYESCLSLRPGQ